MGRRACPASITGDEGIPVATLWQPPMSRSMKTVYRYGLGHRYGRLMQAIAGIHYNCSMPDCLLAPRLASRGRRAPGNYAPTTSASRYLGTHPQLPTLLLAADLPVRRLARGLLQLPQGARQPRPEQPFDDPAAQPVPAATAPRCAWAAWATTATRRKGWTVCYNSLDNYVETLHAAPSLQPHRALRPHSHRPERRLPAAQRQPAADRERVLQPDPPQARGPGRARRHSTRWPVAGIEYIEVRCIDVSPFTPVGLDASADPLPRHLSPVLPACRTARPATTTEQATAGRQPRSGGHATAASPAWC